MKIALVSTYGHPMALGLRYVSSALKAAGHDVEMLFMCSRRDTARPDFEPASVEAFIERCRRAELIGLSLMTNTFRRARFLTERFRAARVGAPTIWGGTHPTVAPDESLEVADMVCVGEGERPMLNLADRLAAGRDPTGVAGIWFRAGGPFGNQHTVRNGVEPLSDDLDTYPFPDYDLSTHWVIEDGQLVQARPGNLRGTLRRLRVASTRGCPCRCTFCNNTTWSHVYKGKGPWVRLRSTDNVIAEIEQMRARFETIEAVNIVDDLFFVRSEEAIEDFARAYEQRVNLPLELDAFPNTVSEQKVAALARLPISLISMGIQSGSADTLRNIYRRYTAPERIVGCMSLFRRYGLPAEYHYIISNPYEPEANVIETMRFAATHHRGPSVLRIFPLMFYPGSPLHERAMRDGLIVRRDTDAYDATYTGRTQFARHDYLSTWLRVVLHLRNAGVPAWFAHRLIDVVTCRPVRWCLDRRAFVPVAFWAYQLSRKVYKGLIYQPFVRPVRSWRRRRWQRRRIPLRSGLGQVVSEVRPGRLGWLLRTWRRDQTHGRQDGEDGAGGGRDVRAKRGAAQPGRRAPVRDHALSGDSRPGSSGP